MDPDPPIVMEKSKDRQLRPRQMVEEHQEERKEAQAIQRGKVDGARWSPDPIHGLQRIL